MIILLRAGIHVPVISKLANPLLAEKEKTFELRNIAEWMLASRYRDYNVVFSQEAGWPSRTQNALNRQHRPPTEAWTFRVYLDSKRNRPSCAGTLVVTFGDDKVPGAREIYRVKGQYAGDAIVYLPSAHTITPGSYLLHTTGITSPGVT